MTDAERNIETPAPRPRMFTPHTKTLWAVTDYLHGDRVPPTEPEVRVRMKPDHSVAVNLPDGERAYLEGGKVYTLPASVAEMLVKRDRTATALEDEEADANLVSTLVAAAKSPGMFEKLMGRVRAGLGL